MRGLSTLDRQNEVFNDDQQTLGKRKRNSNSSYSIILGLLKENDLFAGYEWPPPVDESDDERQIQAFVSVLPKVLRLNADEDRVRYG